VWNLQLVRQLEGLEVIATHADGREVYRATKSEGATHTIKLTPA